MITGKIILKSATKLSLDQRFGNIAKQAPPTPRIPQQTHVIIPQSRTDLFGNKRSAALNTANRLKKRSINYRLGFGNNNAGRGRGGGGGGANRPFMNPRAPRVFQRISYGNRRRGGGGIGGGANSYLFGGQSGMGVRLRGQGRIETRIFRSQKRGYLNNNTRGRFGGFQRRGNNNNYNNNNNNNQGRRFGNRPNRGRGRGGNGNGNRNFTRGRGGNNRNNNTNFSKETLDNDLEKYMSQTKIDNDSIDMNAI
ncbi:unnamed protein product [Adineta steineri]|uniref:Chromatin target of PRMT1 protein C-terminal domain-containing protein n=1 Tax=Adineta steineri TaxID=433720 RepID=A0A814HX27_9BILA|nr:unnamed protein product [Adineta steineri]CAF1200704.1 unnamed protein product [Adineta steineri]CAF1255613.1 unnamed protein product [Adineta steineri]